MIVALYIFLALVAVGTLLYISHRRDTGNDVPPESAPAAGTQPQEEECCGMHITCERDSLLTAMASGIEYYDDEELDRFKSRDPESYTSDEVEEFRSVLLTLLPHDIAGWARSIQLRGIELPPEVRDELLMIVAEERQARAVRQQS